MMVPCCEKIRCVGIYLFLWIGPGEDEHLQRRHTSCMDEMLPTEVIALELPWSETGKNGDVMVHI